MEIKAKVLLRVLVLVIKAPAGFGAFRENEVHIFYCADGKFGEVAGDRTLATEAPDAKSERPVQTVPGPARVRHRTIGTGRRLERPVVRVRCAGVLRPSLCMVPVSVDIWERNKELIRKRTNIGEHFTREVIQSIVFIFLPLGKRVHLTNPVYYY